MKDRKKLLINIFQLMALVLIGGYLIINVVQFTFASSINKEPNVIVTINGDGSLSQQGNLFGHGLLYPSRVEDAERGEGGVNGIIRIVNGYKAIKVSTLGVGLERDGMVIGKNYPISEVYDSFLDNIRLKIEKGSLLVFDKTLIDYTKIRDLLYTQDSEEHRGLVLENTFDMSKGSSVDLKYTLHMDTRAGNELQAVTAEMPVYINMHELKVIDDDPHKPDDDDDGKHTIKTKTPLGKAHWAHDCIITLLNHGVIYGYPHEDMTIEDYRNGRVDPVTYVNEGVLPEKLVTRAETAALVCRAIGLDQENKLFSGYIDPIPSWVRGYVIATTEAKVFKGYPLMLFKANNYITREEIIAVLDRAFKMELEDEGFKPKFDDWEDVSKWARRSVMAGCENDIILGYPDKTYKPQNYVTRAETFTMICKLMGLHEEHTDMGN